MAACQWSGTAISATSTSFSASSARWSVKLLALGASCLARSDLRAVDVAQRHHIDVAGLDELPHVAAAAFAAADEAELHPVVGAENPGIGKRRGGGDATEKGPAGHVGIET